MIPVLLKVVEWGFLLYFLCLNSGYLSLNFISLWSISRYMNESTSPAITGNYEEFLPPVTVIIPAYNEEKSIVSTVRSVLQLDYPELEVIVVNDGSTDSTLEKMREAFECESVPETYRQQLETSPVREFYHSRKLDNLRLVDKENGGKADSLNAGINAARYPLFCAIDADSILERGSLRKLVGPFLKDSSTVATGGSVRVANGSRIRDGFLEKVGVSLNPLTLFQVVEYLRAFLFGRMGWSPLNGLLVISGAFGLFRRRGVIRAGGYHTDNVAEDMELILRLHSYFSGQEDEYSISFVPDPVCWTETPADLKSLRNQRIRWHQGLSQSMAKNFDLLFKPGSGVAGWVAYPFWAIFEWWGPVVEVTGYLLMALGFLFGFVSPGVIVLFFLVSVAFGSLLSILAIVLEEISFRVYPSVGQLFLIIGAALVENFGYRQVNSYWRLLGLLRWLRGTSRTEWGEIRRAGLEK